MNQLSLCHSDNSLEVNGLVTPLHIVPEWYFLGSYAVLKAIPSKVEGFIIFSTSVLILLLAGEGKTISTLSAMITRDLFCTHFFLLLKYGLWIGAQLPQDIFLSYGRVLNIFGTCTSWSGHSYLGIVFIVLVPGAKVHVPTLPNSGEPVSNLYLYILRQLS